MQHKNPCSTCPFTSSVNPGELGGSPPEVYVAQHFMPYRVPCHEFIDYSHDDWKAAAAAMEGRQCVGFAMCRNGGGVDTYMPEELLRSPFREEQQGFRNIWQFWAHHNQVGYVDAVRELNPSKIIECCRNEWSRGGRTLHRGEESSDQIKALERQVLQLVCAAYHVVVQELL